MFQNSSTTREKIQSCTTCSQITSQIVNKKSYEVKFTAFEFLAASSRLSPLNLEGMEHFVANMLDQAINCRQKVPKCVKPVNLFPKKIKEEKNSNFCTIRNPQQSHQQLEHPNYNNNNNKGEVFIFGQTVAPVSCAKFHLKNDSNGQMSSSHPQEVIAGHNYQSLYSSVTPSYTSSSRVSNRDRGGAKAYTTLEALNQDIRGNWYFDTYYWGKETPSFSFNVTLSNDQIFTLPIAIFKTLNTVFFWFSSTFE